MNASRLMLGLFWLVVGCGGATAPTEQTQTARTDSVPSSPDPEDDPWAGCAIGELQGTVRTMSCSDFEMRIMRGQVLRGRDGVDTLANQAPYGAQTRSEVIPSGGMEIPARVHDRFLIAAPRPEILVICVARGPELLRTCRRAVASLAAQGLPPGMSFPEPRLELLGRALTIPSGCALTGTEYLACPSTGAILHWREQAARPGGPEPLTVLGNILRSRFADLVEERSSCSLVGQPGDGARYTMRINGALGHAVVCVVTSGETIYMAQCNGQLAAAARLPSPCDQVFDPEAPNHD